VLRVGRLTNYSFIGRQKGRQRISNRGGNPLLEGPAAIELEPTAPRGRLPDGISKTLKNRNLRDGRKSNGARLKRRENICASASIWNLQFLLRNAKAFLKVLTILLSLQTIGGRSSPNCVFRSPVEMDRSHKGAHRARNRR
jgi:hypothetical protein